MKNKIDPKSAYFVVQFSMVTSAEEEAVSALAFSHGALGVSEALAFTQPEGEETVFTESPLHRTLQAYFASPPSAQLQEEVKKSHPEVQVKISEEQNKDWLAEWKKGFKPFPLTKHHWIVPSWCKPPAEAKHKILIDPGMAFGTGTHETTQLCAEAIEKALREREVESLLDVGTGTGVLAILAHSLWVPTVAATELEEDSRRVARENFLRNECEDIELSDLQIENLSEKYDIVVANIIDGVLVRVQNALKARVKAGGWLIVSGIIAEREQDFLSGFKLSPGKKWNRRTQKGDWLCYETEL